MINDDYEKKFDKYITQHNSVILATSPAKQSQLNLDALYNKDLSESLKKMQVEYLRNANKNCYQEKHLDDTFTNYEQINLCKALERQKLFGKFESNMHKVRDSSQFKYQDCMIDANNNMDRALGCIGTYLTDILTDN